MSYKRWINSPFAIHLFVIQVFNRISCCIAHTVLRGLDRTTGGNAPPAFPNTLQGKVQYEVNLVSVLKKKKSEEKHTQHWAPLRKSGYANFEGSSRPRFLSLRGVVMRACDEISLLFELYSSISTAHPWELTAWLLPVYFISSYKQASCK